MPDVSEIITRLRAGAFENDPNADPNVALPDAVTAVVAAVDARTAEIVKLVEGYDAYSPTGIMVRNDIAAEVARRFPNGGTNDAS